MTGGRCVKHDNWHAECRRCLEDAAYVQGVADERARVVAFLRAADSECLVWFAAQRIEQGWHERFECVPNLDNGGE